MENRRLIVGMMLAMMIIFAWTPLVNIVGRLLGYDMDRRTAQTEQADPSAPASPEAAPAATRPATAEAFAQAPAPVGATPALAPQSGAPLAHPLGSAERRDAQFVMQVLLASRGASVQQVTLNDYRREVRSDEPFVYQQAFEPAADATRALATRRVIVNGAPVPLDAAEWQLVESSGVRAVWALTLQGAAGPTLRLTKTYELGARGREEDLGYEVLVRHGIENLSGEPLEVALVVNGVNPPPPEIERGQDRKIVGGYLDEDRLVVQHHFIENFSKDTPVRAYGRGESGEPLLWFGAASIYFAAFVLPDPIVGGATPEWIERVDAALLDPDNRNAHDRHVALAMTTKGQRVAPGERVDLPMRVYFGPKKRSVLNDAFYAALPRGYGVTLALSSGLCAICTFQWLINILVAMLGAFHVVLRDWGLAIIALVFIVRLLLHPITKRSQVSMMKMSKLGPELERIKKKYGDNKEEMNKAMMQFYKEQGASPFLGCLPMFLQMPIWIALYTALQNTFELRQAPFLHFGGIPFTWIYDLSQPDHLVRFESTFNLLGLIPISGLNILPLLLAVVFYLQFKMTPKAPATTPEQETQQKMMQWMTLLFPIFLYGGPSGLNLYILTSTTIGIIEARIVRNHIKRKEEEEAAGKVIVDARPTRASRQQRRDAPTTPAAKRGGLLGWLQDLQQKAEQMRNEQARRARKN